MNEKDEKEQRVIAAISDAAERGEPITKTAIAAKARVGLSYIYRHPGLRAQIEAHAAGDEDRFNVFVTVALSPRQEALIKRQLGPGETMSRWLREAAMERAGRELGTDPEDLGRQAAGQAPRRANYSKAAKETGQ